MYPSNRFFPTFQRRRHLNEIFRDETVTFKSKFRGHPRKSNPSPFCEAESIVMSSQEDDQFSHFK